MAAMLAAGLVRDPRISLSKAPEEFSAYVTWRNSINSALLSSGSDPVSTLLAAYAISCKLTPANFKKKAEGKCEVHMRLGMRPGHSELHGMDEQDFMRNFSK